LADNPDVIPPITHAKSTGLSCILGSAGNLTSLQFCCIDCVDWIGRCLRGKKFKVASSPACKDQVLAAHQEEIKKS